MLRFVSTIGGWAPAMTAVEDVDFGPVRERVSWAGRPIERMRKLVDAYVRELPFHVMLFKSPDGTMIAERAELTFDPPTQLSLALGDVIHHLRAALDQLVGALRVGGPSRS